MHSINTSSEFEKLISSRKLSVVDFYADWCGPCKMIAPRFEELSKRYPNVQFCKVNVDQHQDIASKYQVRAMPTFLFFKDGNLVETVVGADINKVEKIVSQNGGNINNAFKGVGRTLSGEATSSVGGWNRDQWVYVIIVGFLVFLWSFKE